MDTKKQRIEYDYTGIGRIKQVRYFAAGDHESPIKTVDFTYDALGNLKTWADGTFSGTLSYDDLQRKTSESIDYGGFSKEYAYTYEANGQKKSFTGPGGKSISYSWDDANRLTGIDIPGQGQITHNTYQWNAPTRTTLPGGNTAGFGYDALMRLTSMAAKDAASKEVMSRSYTWSDVDTITKKTTEHGTYTYAYDELNRLTSADNPTLDDEAYTYDAMGNRLTSSGSAETWAYNANNEIQAAGSITFDHDANGNMTRKSKGDHTLHFVYDVEDRLVQVKGGDNHSVATYGYDPFGRRLVKEVGGTKTFFFYADEGLIGEYDSKGAELRSYGWAPDTLWGTSPLWQKTQNLFYWYQNDILGTPQKLIRTNGSPVWSATFDAFGNGTIGEETITSNLRFAGHYFDAETGLHYNLNRYYDPETGRYLREDPLGDGLNLYAYCYNNPNSLMDPLGLCVIRDPHTWLAAGGMIPGIGIFFDLADALFCLYEGDFWGALLSFGSAVPGLGQGLRGAQYGAKYADEVVDVAKNVKKSTDDFVDLTGHRKKHILDGDKKGGGHRYGTGKSGKSEFPQDWSDEKILHEISDVATDRNSKRGTGRWGAEWAEGTRDGVDIHVDFYPPNSKHSGSISTGFPTNTPKNP